MDRADADYIATAYSEQSGVAAKQADIDALTTLYRDLATELVTRVDSNPAYLDKALIELEDSAKAAFYGLKHPE